MRYSSVVGWGDIFIISDDEERREGLNSIMKHYTNRKEFTYKQDVFNKTTILKLEIKTMTGKKIGQDKVGQLSLTVIFEYLPGQP